MVTPTRIRKANVWKTHINTACILAFIALSNLVTNQQHVCKYNTPLTVPNYCHNLREYYYLCSLFEHYHIMTASVRKQVYFAYIFWNIYFHFL
jgi:hypothetical protein